MLFKVLAVAGWAAVAAVSAVSAQSLGGPAENPPSSFKGAQYVDSRGCVFMRAGIGGRVNWVPRVSRDRKALCGQSRAAAVRDLSRQAAAESTRAPSAASANDGLTAVTAPNPARITTANRPMETIASVAPAAVARAAAKPVMRAPAAVATASPRTGAPRMQACPSSSPYGVRVTLTDGRRTLLCSADAGFDVQAAASRLQTARNTPASKPVAAQPRPKAAGAGYKCPASAPIAQRFALRSGGSTVMCTTAGGGLDGATPPLALGDRSAVTVPDGYKLAWQDDRLNPKRGQGTALGQAQQDQIWTRDIPAKLVTPDSRSAAVQPARTDTYRKTVKRKVYVTSASNASRTVKAPAAMGRMFVQVGTFGDAGNTARSVQRLQALGLPVAKSRITSKGRNLQIVMAGPFGDAGSAKAALSAARRAGFGDAFIR